MVTTVGYAGHDPVTLLAIDAISAFDNGVHATATVTGNRLVISVGGFLLNCQRDGSSAILSVLSCSRGSYAGLGGRRRRK